MDNGEILLLGAAKTDRTTFQNGEETVAAISADGGATWSDYQAIGYGRPVMLTDLGGGTLSYNDGGLMAETVRRFVSVTTMVAHGRNEFRWQRRQTGKIFVRKGIRL